MNMSHVAHVNGPCRTWEWVMSHVWMSHVAHVSESCRTCEWVTMHMGLSHITFLNINAYTPDHIDESHRMCEWVMSHVWMSHVTRGNASCRTCEWVMSHIRMNHATHLNIHTYTFIPTHTHTHTHGRDILYVPRGYVHETSTVSEKYLTAHPLEPRDSHSVSAYRALLPECTALVLECRALLIEDRALLTYIWQCILWSLVTHTLWVHVGLLCWNVGLFC